MKPKITLLHRIFDEDTDSSKTEIMCILIQGCQHSFVALYAVDTDSNGSATSRSFLSCVKPYNLSY